MGTDVDVGRGSSVGMPTGRAVAQVEGCSSTSADAGRTANYCFISDVNSLRLERTKKWLKLTTNCDNMRLILFCQLMRPEALRAEPHVS